jgi:hypothetical protein
MNQKDIQAILAKGSLSEADVNTLVRYLYLVPVKDQIRLGLRVVDEEPAEEPIIPVKAPKTKVVVGNRKKKVV